MATIKQLPKVNFRLGVYEASKVTSSVRKILLEDLADALAPIVHAGSIEQVAAVNVAVETWPLRIMHEYAREAIRARDAMACVDSTATGIMRPDGVYFESALGRFVYRQGRLEPLKGG